MAKIKIPKKVYDYIQEQIKFYGLEEMTGNKDIRLVVAISKGIGDLDQKVANWIDQTPHSYALMHLVILAQVAKTQKLTKKKQQDQVASSN